MPSRPPPGSRMVASRPQPWSLTGPSKETPRARRSATRLLDVVADEVELHGAGGLGRMHRDLARRQLEDRPAATGVGGGQPQQVLEERPVRLGVGAVEDHVRAADHPSQPRTGCPPVLRVAAGHGRALPRPPPRHDGRRHRRERQPRDGAAAPPHRPADAGWPRSAGWPAGSLRTSRPTPVSAGTSPTSAGRTARRRWPSSWTASTRSSTWPGRCSPAGSPTTCAA